MPMTPMVAGMRIASRFVLEQPASSGAMGTVFQARDLQTGLRVALKLLHSAATSPQSVTRFELEAELLAKLQHPHIVSYIAHGRTPTGLPFLAMEWLAGEDLAQRLRRCLLSLSECLILLRGVASALASAHRSGVIHRDIKPSNLFLPGKSIDQVKLLDFGVAREELTALALTRTGSILGTLEYMAPEQARGAHEVGPSADIFSLGCVAYECLTGRPPLARMSFPEQLIKMYTEAIPPIDMLRPGLPPTLVTLLNRMLAKAPEQRPQDGTALLRELDKLGTALSAHPDALLPVVREPFAQVAQRLLCVVLASSLDHRQKAPRTLDAAESSSESHTAVKDPQETLGRWGAFTEWLSDGSLLVTLTERGTAADLAVQASRVALYLSQLWPTCTLVLATGLGEITEGRASGEVIERMLGFLHVQRAGEHLPSTNRGQIRLDEVTAGLIDPLFVVRRWCPGLFELGKERDYLDVVRPLAGRLTPCVGRERELATLTALLAECIDESMARVALVVAQSGRGKSRLRHELLLRLRKSHPGLTVLVGRVDPQSTGVSGALLTECLHQLGGVVPGDTPQGSHAKVEQMLRRTLPVGQLERWLVPLCELGTQPLVPECPVPPLAQEREARRAQLEQAFVQLLLALSAAGPVLVILEDLQSADALSVRVWNRGLSELGERPLMILALARPEVHAIFPRLWAEHRVQELRLEPLLPSVCEQLVYMVLGPAAPAAPHIVEHCRGNALFLEELILHAATNPTSQQLPATLIAMEQGRLLRLPAQALRVLRAAGACGMTFWEDSIYSLLAPIMPREHIDSGIQALVAGDLIFRQRQSRIPDTSEFRFRHALTLVAAALLLTEADRELGRTVMARYL